MTDPGVYFGLFILWGGFVAAVAFFLRRKSSGVAHVLSGALAMYAVGIGGSVTQWILLKANPNGLPIDHFISIVPSFFLFAALLSLALMSVAVCGPNRAVTQSRRTSEVIGFSLLFLLLAWFIWAEAKERISDWTHEQGLSASRTIVYEDYWGGVIS